MVANRSLLSLLRGFRMREIVQALIALWLEAVLLGASPARALEPVVLQLRWMHQFQFAGYYAALHQGYYRDAGLDVVIGEGGPGADPVGKVLAGHADFGIGTSSLVIDYLKGKPVLMLGPVFQHSPNALIVRGRDRRPVDLALAKDDKIALMGGNQDIELKAMFIDEGIALDKLHFVPDEHHLDDFIAGRIAALNAYTSNEPYLLDQLGIDYTVLNPFTYGMDFYGDVLFTRLALAEAKPAMVAAFRAATLRGWQYALDHQQEVIDLILARYNNQQKTREHLAFEAREIHRLINPEVIQLGHNNPGRWQHIAQDYQRFDLVQADQPLEGFFYQPDPKADFAWLYRALAAALGVLLLALCIAAYVHRTNRRLKRALAEKLAAEEQIRELAFFDPLTRLPNRRLLLDRLGCLLASLRRDGGHGALMFLDLDNFKPLNDTHGHAAGDRLLIEAARRLRECVRDTDTVARFGGDEFVVLLGDLDRDDKKATAQVKQVAHKILEGLAQPYALARAADTVAIDHRCTASIGLAVFDGSADEADALHRADAAMYCAKKGGRNCIASDVVSSGLTASSDSLLRR
jgi:diguanylate cyclase (GGDEF)-like protein